MLFYYQIKLHTVNLCRSFNTAHHVLSESVILMYMYIYQLNVLYFAGVHDWTVEAWGEHYAESEAVVRVS